MKISKMANIVYTQISARPELPQQIPAPRAKAWMQKPQGGGKFLVQIPGVRGGMAMDEICTALLQFKIQLNSGPTAFEVKDKVQTL